MSLRKLFSLKQMGGEKVEGEKLRMLRKMKNEKVRKWENENMRNFSPSHLLKSH